MERAGSFLQGKEELTYRDVINITTNPPAQRNKKDVQAVSDWIMKKTSLFADMDKDIVYNVIKNCKCQVMLRDSVVVKQGEKGDAFYIILHGQVSVFVKEVTETKKSLLSELLQSDEEQEKPEPPEPEPSDHSEEEEEPQKPTGPSVRQRFRKTLTQLKITRQITPKMKKRLDEKKPDPRQTLGQRVSEMNDGDAFGELALLNSDNKRAASCITETDVVFLVVARELYNKSIKSFQTRQMALIRRFVSQHPFFQHWPSKLQSQVHNSIIQIKHHPGETVLRQGQPYNGLYFLIQGEVKVTINGGNHSKQYTDPSMGTDLKQKEEESSCNRHLGHCEILRSLSMPNVHVRRRGGYAAAEQFQSNKHKDLCLSGPTIIFGDIEHILAIGTYVQSITAESMTRLFQINKDNWDRLLKLANNMGHAVSNPTITCMAEMAYTTWINRLEKVATSIDGMASLDYMIQQLLKHPTLRAKSAIPMALTKEEKMFESLLTSYLTNRTPLIQPCVEGGHYYRSLMQERAELRKRQQARRGTNAKPPHSLRPLKNRRLPRSIATLKEQIKKYKTSDVDVLVPKTKRKVDLDPIRQPVKPDTNNAPYTYGHPAIKSIEPPEKPEEPLQDLDLQLPRTVLTVEPVLITERPQKCDEIELVEGKTLKFYSQYLRGRLDDEYNKPLVDPEVFNTNRETELLEEKLHRFLGQQNDVCRLHRLDESKPTTILPGGKCLVEKTPCRLLRKTFPLQAHEHIKRHMVEH